MQARCNSHRGTRRARRRGASESLREPAAGVCAVLRCWAGEGCQRKHSLGRVHEMCERRCWPVCPGARSVDVVRCCQRRWLGAPEREAQARGRRGWRARVWRRGSVALRSLPAQEFRARGGRAAAVRCGVWWRNGRRSVALCGAAKWGGQGLGGGERAHAAKGSWQCERARWRRCEPEWLGEPTRAKPARRRWACGVALRAAECCAWCDRTRGARRGARRCRGGRAATRRCTHAAARARRCAAAAERALVERQKAWRRALRLGQRAALL
jgi:hypothetical protein